MEEGGGESGRRREKERESVGGRGRRADALPRLSPSCFVESRIGDGRGEKGEGRECVEASVPTECWVPCVISSSPPVVSFWGEGFQEPRLPPCAHRDHWTSATRWIFSGEDCRVTPLLRTSVCDASGRPRLTQLPSLLPQRGFQVRGDAARAAHHPVRGGS